MAKLIPNEQLLERLAAIPKWDLSGTAIRRTFEFDTFLDGVAFVQRVAGLAEEANHHPDIDIRWRKVQLLLTTHSAGGLTTKDFELAARFDALV